MPFQPLTSRDLDFHGGVEEALFLAKAVGDRHPKLNRQMDPTPQAGIILAMVGQKKTQRIQIDVLTSVTGLKDMEIARTAILIAPKFLGKQKIRILHPLQCLISKAAALRSLNQKARQDEKHLRIACHILRHFLRERIEPENPRKILPLIEQVFAAALCEAGLNAHLHGINLEESIPICLLPQHPAWEPFLEKRLPQLQEQLRIKRERRLDMLAKFEKEALSQHPFPTTYRQLAN